MKTAGKVILLIIVGLPALYFWAIALYYFDAWLAELLPWTVP